MSAAPESMVGQWLLKADHDYGSAHDLIEFSSDCAYDVVCFLCQQCVEKYLKAMLVLNGLDVPRTHDLTQIFAAIPSRDSLAIEINELANTLCRRDALSRPLAHGNTRGSHESLRGRHSHPEPAQAAVAALARYPAPIFNAFTRSLNCAAFSNSNFRAASLIRSSNSPMNRALCSGVSPSTSSSPSSGTVT